jgi:protocatechuate 3,4-dioxygenase beta subunit
MDKRTFLKTSGLLGIASLLPLGKTFSLATNNAGGCSLIPSETAGPYPLDLSTNASMFRIDVRETQQGADHLVKLKIIGSSNCLPMPNCRIDIWHCNAFGYYSGYTTSGQMGSQNNIGQTWLRGIQMTDANGEVQFLTKFPGWYSGRVSHIHFQVFLSSVLQVTSQFTFPIQEKNTLYTTVAPYASYGADPTNPSNDNVFSDGYGLQLATLTFNSSTNQYESYFEATINGTGTTGLQKMEPETGGQFKLGQNFPNPYSEETTIPFILTNPSDVKIELWDITGRKVATIKKEKLGSGEQSIKLNMKLLGIPSENYVYQIEVVNSNGSFRQCKMMTATR